MTSNLVISILIVIIALTTACASAPTFGATSPPISTLTSLATRAPKSDSRIPRVVFMDIGNSGPLYESFRQALSDLGYVDGKNIVIDYQSADVATCNCPAKSIGTLMHELVGMQVDVIVAANQSVALQLKFETKTVPIVMATSNDAVEAGLIESLAHPGGNVTGMTIFAPMLGGKRLDLLKQTIIGLERGAVMGCPSASGNSQIVETRAAAQALKIDLTVHNAGGSSAQLSAALQRVTKANFDAILVQECDLFNRDATLYANLFGESRLPTMYFAREFVVASGLMSYGPNLSDSFRRAAAHVDKILKGAKPADLPVELPTKFDFVINLKTAKQLGITIPPAILTQATEVIQ